MADVPHFALPFRYEQGRPVVVEQDSVDDVAACVEAVLRTRPGEREESPDFGSPDLAFRQRPLDLDEVVGAVSRWEPRARLLAQEDPERLDEAVARVQITVRTEEQ